MTKKTKKGYLWIFDQQDKWDDIASDKIIQLEQMQATHLDWFDKHSTVSELLALRRPDLKRKHASISTAITSSQIVPSEDNVKESNAHDFSESIDVETLDEKNTEEAVKPAEIQSIDTDMPIADKVIITANKQMDKDAVNQTTTNKADATEIQTGHVHKTNTITIPPSKVKPTALIRPYTASTAQPQKPKTRSIIDDYDEEADQVQIVVSARKPNSETKEKSSPTASPPRQPQVSKSTPTKTFSLSHIKPSIPTSNASTYRSAFMNRLFKTSRPSLKTAALPTASISTSSATTVTSPASNTATAISPHKDSHSNHPVIITKRSSTASVRSVSSSTHSTPIQASEIMPEPRFKRFKALQKMNNDLPVVVQTHDLSTVEEVDEPSKSQSQSQNQTESQSQKENQVQNSQEDASLAIPTWAEGTNLLNELKRQSTMSPDKIFGCIQPVDVQEIFP